MSTQFLTKSQAHEKLTGDSSYSGDNINEFVTRYWLESNYSSYLDASLLTEYSDLDYVIDDDILQVVIGSYTFSLSGSRRTFEYTGGTNTTVVRSYSTYSNGVTEAIPWTITDISDSWITTDINSGTEQSTEVTITTELNDTNVLRTGTITFTLNDTENTAQCSIIQYASPLFLLFYFRQLVIQHYSGNLDEYKPDLYVQCIIRDEEENLLNNTTICLLEDMLFINLNSLTYDYIEFDVENAYTVEYKAWLQWPIQVLYNGEVTYNTYFVDDTVTLSPTTTASRRITIDETSVSVSSPS